MDKQIKNFNELISNASDYLESQLHYSLRTVGNYRRCWKQVRNILDSQGIKQYDPDEEPIWVKDENLINWLKKF